jgi:hypothetical protein
MDEKEISILDIYPGQTDEWYRESEENIKRYVAIMWRIDERLRKEGKRLAQGTFELQ